jgi:cytosine/adenosine deaminase-related metal-dependent hydrolase
MHLLETERQRLWADRTYPTGFLRFLDEIGLLSPRLTVAHGVWLRPEECALLAERGVTVVINLSSNRRLRSGEPPLAAMRAAGLGFGHGLDALSFDDDEDMLRELRLVARLDALTPAELFDAALISGRRTILGEDGGGRIAVGAPADFLVLDYAALVQDCIGDGVEACEIILARAALRHVTSLFVAGREVARDGRCVGVDIEAAEAELVAQARAHRRSDPPDMARIARLQEALERHYAGN